MQNEDNKESDIKEKGKSNLQDSNTAKTVKNSVAKTSARGSKDSVDSVNAHISKYDVQSFLTFAMKSTSPCAILFRESKLSRSELRNTQPMFKDASNFIKNPTLCRLYKTLLNEYNLLAPALRAMSTKVVMKDDKIILERNYELCFSGCSEVYNKAKLKTKSELHARLDCLFSALLLILVENHKILQESKDKEELAKSQDDVSLSTLDKNDGNVTAAKNSNLITPISERLNNIGVLDKNNTNELVDLLLTNISETLKESLSKIAINTPTSSTFTLIETLFNIIDAPLEKLLRCIKSDDIRSRVKDILSSIIKAAIGICVAYASSYISEKISLVVSAVKMILPS